MNNQEKLHGLIKETVKEQMPDYEAKLEAHEEEIAHLKEENKEWKERMDSLQDKAFKLNTKTGGEQIYRYKGYNPEHNKNFRGTLTEDEAEHMAKTFLDVAQGKAIDFASEMPQEFGSTILGLGELYSSALAHMNVLQASAPIITLPVKATRETADAQASATANVATSITAANIVWTIDTRIGSYAEVRVDQLEDAYFDLVNGWVVPLMAEGIGQYVDGEVFNGANSIFTTSINDATASVTASGTVATAAAITLANLNTMFYAVEWERGLGECKWFGSRAALKDIMGLTDTYGQPVMRTVPVNGKPVHYVFGSEYVITPVVANAPAANAIRLCFGDPNHYTIFLRGGEQHLVNPYIKMKEDVVQFIAKLRADGNIDDNATASSSGAWTTLQRVDA
jgi:HK97 family phage major capsid protein